MALDIRVRLKRNSIIIKVTGRIIGMDDEKFAKKLESTCAKTDRVILDLSETDFLDSHGLGTIVYYFHNMQKRRGDFIILNANPNPNGYVKRLFELTNLDKILNIVDSTDSIDNEDA
jgi:anti-anti-sigma factor